MITAHELSKTFDPSTAPAVRSVSFTVADAETLVLLGSSGCGKTTTLKMINRLVEPTSGRVEIDGADATTTDPLTLRRSIGYVFQDIGLFPHMTARENIEIVPRLLGWSRPRRRARAEELLDTVGLPPSDFADRRPSHMSGGQQQRVGLARALASDPRHLLMDEPFGALDAVTRDQLQTELLNLKLRLHKTIVFVTHDLFEALRLADRIAVMNEGRIEQIGARRELIDSPATPFVAALFDQARRQAQLLADGGVS